MNQGWVLFLTIVMGFSAIPHVLADQDLDLSVCVTRVAERELPRIQQMDGIDKTKHCALSCIMAYRCNAFGSFAMGVMKELSDLVTPDHEPSVRDLQADWVGVRYGMMKKYSNRSLDCKSACRARYDRKLESFR